MIWNVGLKSVLTLEYIIQTHTHTHKLWTWHSSVNKQFKKVYFFNSYFWKVWKLCLSVSMLLTAWQFTDLCVYLCHRPLHKTIKPNESINIKRQPDSVVTLCSRDSGTDRYPVVFGHCNVNLFPLTSLQMFMLQHCGAEWFIASPFSLKDSCFHRHTTFLWLLTERQFLLNVSL